MTKEEARRYMIQWQQELKDGGFPIDSDRIQALRVAIEALKADAVSREECNCVFSKPKIKLPKKAVGFNFSNVEVVVRCKDCKWSDWYKTLNGEHRCYCMEHGSSGHTDDDYCSYGERREE